MCTYINNILYYLGDIDAFKDPESEYGLEHRRPLCFENWPCLKQRIAIVYNGKHGQSGQGQPSQQQAA